MDSLSWSMSPSDISHSSGASGNASTRETSPDSLGAPFVTKLPLPMKSYAADRLDNNMEPDIIPSASEWRGARSFVDRGGPAQVSGQMRSNITSHLSPASPPRSTVLSSSNWRAHPSGSSSPPSLSLLDHPHTSHPLTSTGFGGGNMPPTTLATSSNLGRLDAYSSLGGGQEGYTIHVPPVAQQEVTIRGMNTDGMYAFCFDRGNGNYTRLIPADMLPPLKDIPATQQGHDGMFVLPMPPAFASDDGSANTQGVQVMEPPSPNPSAADPIQSHIDNIVSQTPSGKKTKIYCDKWVHEGVCAFTQQGCKYKHEMPQDRATQHALGLFQGLPAWYKRHQSELQRSRAPDTGSDLPVALRSPEPPRLPAGGGPGGGPGPARVSRFAAPWRRTDTTPEVQSAAPGPSRPGTTAGGIQQQQQQPRQPGYTSETGFRPMVTYTLGSASSRPRQDYGPIAPPARKPLSNPSAASHHSAIVTPNPFAHLHIDDDFVDESVEDDKDDRDDSAGAKLT